MIWIIAYFVVGIVFATIAVYQVRTRPGRYNESGDDVGYAFLSIAFWPFILLLTIPILIGKWVADRRNKRRSPTHDDFGPNDYR